MNIRILFLSILVFILGYNGYCQEIVSWGDSIEIGIQGYNAGKIQWQFSSDKQTWYDIKDATGIKFYHKVIEPGYFRAKVTGCNVEFISDTTFIGIIYISRWKFGKKSVTSFTFDDNNLSNDQVAQLFNKYNFSATFYFISDFLSDYLKIGNVRPTMQHFLNHEIGSHSANHIPLTQLQSYELFYELKASRDSLSKFYNRNITSIAFPKGAFNDRIMELSRNFYLFQRYYYFPGLNTLLGNTLFDDERALFTLDQIYETEPRKLINRFKNDGAWITFMGHGIGVKSGDYGYQITIESLERFLEECKSNDDLWVDNFSNVCLYYETRKNSTLFIQKNEITVFTNYKFLNRLKSFGIISIPLTLELTWNKKIRFLGKNIISSYEKGEKKYVTIDLGIDNKISIEEF